jgi:hypothetical protein
VKPGVVIIMIVVLVLTGVFGSVAWAGSSTTTIIKDASDGTVSGHYSAAQVRAALAAVENNPTYAQYSDIAGVLQHYLSSLSGSGATTPSSSTTTSGTGQTQTSGSSRAAVPTTPRGVALDYTGGQPLVLFAVGGVLVIAGAVLRRRWA